MKKCLVLVLALVMSLGLLADCRAEGASELGTHCRVPVNAKVTMLPYADGASLFPVNTSQTMETQNLCFVYETLLVLDKDSNYQWWLATGVEVSDDNLEYTFALRKGINFTDGTPWNAQTAKFNFDYLSDQSLGHYRTTMYRFIERTEIVDEYTIKIVLNQVYAPFLNILSQNHSAMLSPKLIEKGPAH